MTLSIAILYRWGFPCSKVAVPLDVGQGWTPRTAFHPPLQDFSSECPPPRSFSATPLDGPSRSSIVGWQLKPRTRIGPLLSIDDAHEILDLRSPVFNSPTSASNLLGGLNSTPSSLADLFHASSPRSPTNCRCLLVDHERGRLSPPCPGVPARRRGLVNTTNEHSVKAIAFPPRRAAG